MTSALRGEGLIWAAPAVGAIVAVASIFVGPKRGDVRVDVAMASMAAFLFGVLLAFTIVRTRERLALVQDLVAKGNASLFSIHQIDGRLSAKTTGDRVRALIDRHLTDQIDYHLVDYHVASPSYLQLIEADLRPRAAHPSGGSRLQRARAAGVEMSEYRALIEAATGQAMSPLEWSGLILLLVVLLGLISVLPGGTALGALVAGTLAGTLATLMILLRKLDLLRWHERVTIWEPTTRLFRNMGHDPYVPREVISAGATGPSGESGSSTTPTPTRSGPRRLSRWRTWAETGPTQWTHSPPRRRALPARMPGTVRACGSGRPRPMVSLGSRSTSNRTRPSGLRSAAGESQQAILQAGIGRHRDCADRSPEPGVRLQRSGSDPMQVATIRAFPSILARYIA